MFCLAGSQSSNSTTFGNQQQGGSRIIPYTSTIDAESGTGGPGKLQSISAMTVHKDKCHEELRWEDSRRGDKGTHITNPLYHIRCLYLMFQYTDFLNSIFRWKTSCGSN